MSSADHVERVHARYASAARRIEAGEAASSCAGPSRYPDLTLDLAPLAGASLGCGDPVAVADLHPGETVLDLGSGAGLDVLASARRVGPIGRAIGLDMTDEMLAIAARHARDAGVTNVEFRKGRIEAIPLPDASVDVVISNCVLALSAEPARVLGEVARVLRPGGRLGVADLVVDAALSPAERAGHATECLDTASTEAEYAALLTAAGLREVEITRTYDAGHGLHGAIVRAVKPRPAGCPEPAGCLEPARPTRRAAGAPDARSRRGSG